MKGFTSGGTEFTDIRVGSQMVKKAYLGDLRIWPEPDPSYIGFKSATFIDNPLNRFTAQTIVPPAGAQSAVIIVYGNTSMRGIMAATWGPANISFVKQGSNPWATLTTASVDLTVAGTFDTFLPTTTTGDTSGTYTFLIIYFGSRVEIGSFTAIKQTSTSNGFSVNAKPNDEYLIRGKLAGSGGLANASGSQNPSTGIFSVNSDIELLPRPVSMSGTASNNQLLFIGRISVS